MPSHLTRSVFRRILSNEPIIHRGCLHRQAQRCISSRARSSPAISAVTRRHNARTHLHDQRRTFFNFNIFAPRQEAREADIDPGIEKMMELAKKERMRARLPPPEEVVKAFTSFFESKAAQKDTAITDTQAELALQSLRYLARVDQEFNPFNSKKYVASLSKPRNRSVLASVTQVLRRESESVKLSQAHVELARFLFELVEGTKFLESRWVTYVFTLTRTGQSELAREVVLRGPKGAQELLLKERQVTNSVVDGAMPSNSVAAMEGSEDVAVEEEVEDDLAVKATTSTSRERLNHEHAWVLVLEGFAKENNTTDVERTLAMMRERGFQDSLDLATVMLSHNLKHGDAPSVRRWFLLYLQESSSNARSIEEQDQDTLETIGNQATAVLRWCLDNNELETGHDVIRHLMRLDSNPPKPVWDAILVWAAGTKKSVEEIERMMGVMEKYNAQISDPAYWRVPDIRTINKLVEYAISRNDPYMAERFISLGRERNIEPDAKTLVLQMEYRLSVEDVDGALKAYMGLQAKDLSSNEDVKPVNRLIVALCGTGRHDFDTIMNVAADLSDRRVRFEPLTVATLSILHLSRDEQDDVLDLLNTHAFHYSSLERESIRDTIIAFVLNPNTSTSRAWLGYGVIKSIFDETPRSLRTEIMSSFFTLRERGDMAVHIFQNMRQHTRANTIPTVETYIAAFLGIAKIKYAEGLEVIHNLLKLDFNINATTKLYNSLMLAYTACSKARSALDFWEEIVASREGPSYNSIHAALRACEKASFGDVKAQRIWTLLRTRGVEMDNNLWASYIAALAGNGDVGLATRTLEAAVETGEVEVTAFVVGSLFAGAGRAGFVKQAEVEMWGREVYPEIWAELVKGGVDLRREDGVMWFVGLDRSVEA